MKKKYSTALIWLCWLIYTCSYIGKINYAANITLIRDFYGVDKAQAGLVSTCFFFAYGIGQVFHGLLCRKYNTRWVIFGSLLIAAITNVTVGLCGKGCFGLIKFVWMINGFCVATLWPTLIRVLTETLSKDMMKKATVTMGTTVAAGTFFVYAVSALLANINFKIIFFIATAIFIVVAVLWALTYPSLVKKIKEKENDETEEVVVQKTQEKSKAKTVAKSLILLCAFTLGIYGVATNLVKDGLTTWVPTILKEQYNLGDSLSIILTLSLPMVSIFGNALAVKVHKKVPDFVVQCAFNFALAGLIIAGVIAGLSLNQFVLTVVGFAAVCLLASSCNSIITSIFPMFMKGKLNSGMMAGLLNGCCYLGSTITSYGLGLIADHFGWYPVFWLLFSICVAVCIVAGGYLIIRTLLRKKEKKEEIDDCAVQVLEEVKVLAEAPEEAPVEE